MTDNTIPLIFIYLGNKVPKYTLISLKLASNLNKVVVYLLTNNYSSFKKSLNKSNVIVVNVDDFYIRGEFMTSYMSHLAHFRGGFWVATLERFFVLDKFVRVSNFDSFIHAELDNVFFDLENLLEVFNFTKAGIYLPRLNEKLMIASFMVVNGNKEIKSFLDFVKNNSRRLRSMNEMEILSIYDLETKNRIFTLRSLPDDYKITDHENPFSYDGIFDAAVIGHWIAGVDARNIYGPVYNLFRNPYVENFFMENYRIEFLNNKLFIINKSNGIKRQVYNLHIHSKKMELFLDSHKFRRVISDASIPRKRVIDFNLRSYVIRPLEAIKNYLDNTPNRIKRKKSSNS